MGSVSLRLCSLLQVSDAFGIGSSVRSVIIVMALVMKESFLVSPAEGHTNTYKDNSTKMSPIRSIAMSMQNIQYICNPFFVC